MDNNNNDNPKIVERIRSKISLKDRLFAHNFEYLIHLNDNFEQYKDNIGELSALAYKLSQEQIETIKRYKVEEENKKQEDDYGCTISSDEVRVQMCEKVYGMCSHCEFKFKL